MLKPLREQLQNLEKGTPAMEARPEQAYGFSMVFVTHDLALVSFICDHTIVMKAGAVVEQGPTAEVIAAPRAAYTRDLIDAVPRIPEMPSPQNQEEVSCS